MFDERHTRCTYSSVSLSFVAYVSSSSSATTSTGFFGGILIWFGLQIALENVRMESRETFELERRILLLPVKEAPAQVTAWLRYAILHFFEFRYTSDILIYVWLERRSQH